MSEDRISKLSKRFSKHAVGRKANRSRNRERRSFYLDSEVVERVDQAYRDLNHQLYPTEINKSLFLETLMEFGLENLDALKATLLEQPELAKSSDNS